MRQLVLTLPTIAENLALDEALLESVSTLGETLRLWEFSAPSVIVGRATRVQEEVDLDYCRPRGIPVLRRCSGGASVVLGRGCLMYAVTLDLQQRPQLAVVDQAHRFVLNRMEQALRSLDIPVQMSGTSDLTLHNQKFSGNSLRCKREAVLYHGTLLYAADLDRIANCLKMPPRQPDYRERRSHRDFLVNLPQSATALSESLVHVWQATESALSWPREMTQQLVRDRYLQDAWNFAR